MQTDRFQAMVVSETADHRFVREIRERSIAELPVGEVLVRVDYSSINYKDVLSATGNRGVTRSYPHTPGIDAAGIVVQSSVPDWAPGDPVIVTSYDLGMNTPGGFGRFIRVPAAWVVPLPPGLSLRESMIYGTAGFTAALSIYRLVNYGITPDLGPVLVSGATGGVGGVAVATLTKLGYRVVAVNGSVDRSAYLRELGATEILSIEEATDAGARPLLKARWAAAVDTVGGPILGTAIRSIQPHGAATCCGNVASHELPLNVYPFILRGVTLIGIDSQNCPMPVRRELWQLIAGRWKLENLERFATEVTLDGLEQRLQQILHRAHQGRTLVKLAP